MRLAVLATIAAISSIVFADTNSWGSWKPATTTLTMTLLHVTNQTVTSTSYSHSSTGTASHVFTNVTSSAGSSSFYKPATLTTSPEAPTTKATTEATIASFSTGAAVASQANIAVAGLLGMGVVAFGLF